jgi:ornithine cyclodeaminase/alanine dehydrogenase-like protein (mu-crystallin family)
LTILLFAHLKNQFFEGTTILEESDIVLLIKEKIGLENFLNQLRQTLEDGFRYFGEGKIIVPRRHSLIFQEGFVLAMSAADSDFFACKVVNIHCNNPLKYNIPSIMASGALVDGKSGYPLMLIGSTVLTALRTATASAIATKYLARNNSQVVGIIGNGVESLPHLHAISLIRNIKKVFVYDIDVKASESLKRLSKRFLPEIDVVIAPAPEIVSQESDILVTATCKGNYTIPIVQSNCIRNGTHINTIGGASEPQIELDKSLLQRAKVVVDFKDDAIYEGESHQVEEKNVYSDLSEVILNLKSGRIRHDEITIFDSIGFAMEDLQMYELVYKLANYSGIGKKVSIIGNLKDSKNIYELFSI